MNTIYLILWRHWCPERTSEQPKSGSWLVKSPHETPTCDTPNLTHFFSTSFLFPSSNVFILMIPIHIMLFPYLLLENPEVLDNWENRFLQLILKFLVVRVCHSPCQTRRKFLNTRFGGHILFSPYLTNNPCLCLLWNLFHLCLRNESRKRC